MDVTRDTLMQHLATSEKELELAKAYLYRADGAIQILKQLLAASEAPAPSAEAHPKSRRLQVTPKRGLPSLPHGALPTHGHTD